jgi:hypothetical protein
MISNIVVAGYNNQGADLFFFKMEVSPQQIENDDYYQAATRYAVSQGYDYEMVIFSDGDLPKALERLFEWDSASVVQCGDWLK